MLVYLTRISPLVAFAVEAMFHPIAYQFFFFCIAGLAVALKALCANARMTADAVETEAAA